MTSPAVPEKWISGFDASQPLADAARRALEQRLEAVEKLLRLVRRPPMSAEEVHQLRVATRRASAALRAFEGCLKNNTRRRMERRLKKLRSAAARVRTADVHLTLLGRQLETASSEDRAAIEHLISFITLERSDRVRALARPARKLSKGKLRRRVKKLLESIKDHSESDQGVSPSTRTFQEAADSSLAVMATDFQDSLAADLNDPEALHAVRLLGKRLRYALEIFAVCLDPTVRDRLYGELASLQEQLGVINDQYELAERATLASSQLQEALPTAQIDATSSQGLFPELQRLQDNYRLAAEQAHQAFLSWWQAGESNAVRESIAHLFGRQSIAEANVVSDEPSSDIPQPEVVIVKDTVEAMVDAADAERSER